MQSEFNPFESTTTEKIRETLQTWQEYLVSERRLSLLTAESYLEDLKEFFTFLLEHLGKEVDLQDLESLKITDFRAFLAWRAEQKISKASIARGVSALKNFFRFLMQEGLTQVALVTHAGVIANALACFGLPKLDPKQIQIAAGEGFEIQINPQLWQQAQAFEILGLIPFLPEEADTY